MAHAAICLPTLCCVLAATPRLAPAIDLAFPTPNQALLQGDGPAFYQYVERSFQGERTQPWEGGQYGYVRNPVPNGDSVVYTRFHEGIDIQPTRRDARGEPIDPVFAVDAGTVVYANPVANQSNYGRYLVIEHTWSGSPYYSLYAHLSTLLAEPGRHVERGQQVAIMGHTGAGITRERAHLHFEINLLVNSHFDEWHRQHFPTDPNHHGIYNGLNLLGLNPARILIESRHHPQFDIPGLLRSEPVCFRVIVPHSKRFELVARYPWLTQGTAPPAPASWELWFNRDGIPIRATPSDTPTTTPTLLEVKPPNQPHGPLCHGLLAGSGSGARLTETGRRFLQLLTMPPAPDQ
jgi:murein DD-endopeptidase MepM/ murein hydrolase activator NlpD